MPLRNIKVNLLNQRWLREGTTDLSLKELSKNYSDVKKEKNCGYKKHWGSMCRGGEVEVIVGELKEVWYD